MAKRYSLAEAFAVLSTSRRAAWSFSSREVAPETVRRILLLTQLAPTSFNLQPYKMIVTTSDDARERLSTCMIAGNAGKVRSAPISVVFLAHKDPYSLTDALIALEQANGSDPHYIRSLPAKLSFLVGPGFLAHKLKKLGSHLASPLTPAPSLSTAAQWSQKQAMFAAQQLLLAAQALRLAAAPMEGFDERRVCFQLGVPAEQFAVPLVVSLGHAQEAQAAHGEESEDAEDAEDVGEAVDLNAALRRRFPLRDVCFQNKFGEPLSL